MTRNTSVAIVDSVGSHRGMHYYNFGLIRALNELEPGRFAMITTDDTTMHPLRPEGVPAFAGFRGIYGDQSRVLRGGHYALSLIRIYKWLVAKRPEIVHFHFFQIPHLDKLLLSALARSGMKIVTTVHDVLPFDSGRDFAALRGSIQHQLYSISSGLVLHSEYSLRALQTLDSSLVSKSQIIPHGGFLEISREYSLDRAKARDRLGLHPTSPVILVFGTIKPNKRLDLAIHALKSLVKVHPHAKLVIAGKLQDRDVDAELSLVKRLQLEDNIIWKLTHQTDQEMGALFSAADIALFPYEWIYQSGAILMAMSFKTPVVTTDVPGNASTVLSGENGLLVPVEDPLVLSQTLRELLEDRDLGERLATNAFNLVRENYSWTAIAGDVLRFYDRVCDKKPESSEVEYEHAAANGSSK